MSPELEYGVPGTWSPHIYMIKKDTEGYRYQQIVLIENKQAHPEKDMILSLLDEFKYKDE
ncbi:MAG: hypothetical protein GY756_11865 [bacterium]|nr:hypothetical protein [bacterium]